MPSSTLRFAPAAAFLALVAPAAGDEKSVSIQAEVPYSSTVNMAENIKAECALTSFQSQQLAEQLAAAGYKAAPTAGLTDKAPGRVLLMEFNYGFSQGHAGIGHEKALGVMGCLFDDGKLAGSFWDIRVSTGGVGGEFKGSCAVLHRCGKAIAIDVAQWLGHPEMYSLLGDANRGNAKAEMQKYLPPEPQCWMDAYLPPGRRTNIPQKK